MRLTNDIASLQELVLQLLNKVETLEATVMLLGKENEALQAKVVGLEGENRVLQAKVTALESENTELKARLNQNSNNSHRPPASDGLRKKPALPRSSGKKAGGQQGHRGKTLEWSATPDTIEVHVPQVCSCGQDMSRETPFVVECRQVVDLPEPKLAVTEHRRAYRVCPACQAATFGAFPTGVDTRMQYGPRVRALSVLLNNAYQVPFNKIRQFFSDVFGYAVNASTQITAAQTCYERLAPSETAIQQALLNSASLHVDETGLRVAGQLNWLHNQSNAQHTLLFVHTARGGKALHEAPSILPSYSNWLVHDCLPTYFTLEHVRHAVCGAHLLRELQGLLEQDRRWAARMHDLLLYAYHQSAYGRAVVPDWPLIERQFDRICAAALREEPPPERCVGKKRPRKTPGRNLLERLQRHRHAVWAFARHAEVPFTNNQAERDLRPTKIKQKMAGCFRTQQGAQIYARIQSFISTTRKHQHNVFNELCAAFSGTTFLLAPQGT